MNTTYTAIVKIEAGGAVANLDEIDKAVKSSNSNLIAMRKELKSVQSELLALEPGSAAFNKLASRAGELRDRMNDVSEQINANAGPAIESIGNQASLLQGKLANLDIAGVGESFSALSSNIRRVSFKDMQAGLQGVTKGLAEMGRALLANPIFLLGAAVAALVANFDAVTKAIDYGVNPATRELVEQTRKLSEVSKAAYEAFDLEERRLRALGVTEDEIAEKRKQASIARLTQIKFELEANQALLNEQAAAYVESVGVATNGLDALVQGVKKLFGPAEEDINATKETIATLGREAEEINVKILELDKKRTDEAKKGSEERIKASDKETDNEARNAEERLKIEQRTQQAIREAQDEQLNEQEKLSEEIYQAGLSDQERELQAVRDAYFEKIELANQFGLDSSVLLEEQLMKEAEINQKYADQEKQLRDQEEADERRKREEELLAAQQLEESKLRIREQFTDAAKSLNELLVTTGLISAKKGFQIAKGIAIAEGTISTIKGVINALTAQTIIPEPFGTILKVANAAAVGIAGAANVAKIAKTQFNSGGGGGGVGGGTSLPTPSAGGGSSLAPAFNPLNTQFLANRPPQQPSVRAYVVANDVASEEEASEKINALSTL